MGLSLLVSLVAYARAVGWVCLSFARGLGLVLLVGLLVGLYVGSVVWLGCLLACLWGLDLVVYHMPGVWACL